MNLLQIFLIWLAMSVLAVINGTIRVVIFQKFVNLQTAHVISCITGIALIQTVIYFYLKLRNFAVHQLLIIGLIWLGLTIAFEFGFGHYVMGHSWEKLLSDYNLLKGRLWSVVLLSVLLGPLIWGWWVKK